MPSSDALQVAIDAQRAGRFEEAEAAYRRVLAERPGLATAHHNLALVLLQRRQLVAALEHMREAARLEPAAPEILNNLGGLCEQTGRMSEAVDAYRRATVAAPESSIPHCNLGAALCRTGCPAEAVVALRAAATLDPDLQPAWAALGAALLDCQQPAAASAALRRAIELRPDDDLSCRRLGDARQALRQFDEAAEAYELATRRNPRHADAWYGLGRSRMEVGRTVQAADAFQHCLAIDRQRAAARHDLARMLFELGCVEQAVTLFRQAAELGSAEVRRHALENLAIIIPGSPVDDNLAVLQARRVWAEQWPPRPAPSRRVAPDDRPLRIGYLSSFFHRANWMKPVWALVQRHDRRRFEIHLFCDGPVEPLRDSDRLQADDRLHGIRGQSNAAAAATIAAEQIDILVDLNGYSVPPRLGLFPLRPAPLQVGWFNSYATSGLDCFDYLIGDSHVIPADEEAFYTERILRVPHSYLTFEVDYPVPDVAPSPLRAGQPLTFGSLASQYKLTDATIETWAETLHACPGTRLLLRNKMLDRPEHQEHLRGRFARHGIAAERLWLQGPVEHFAFLDTYRHIDVALDPFPYSGGTTTMEALWQGVPVVTFAGDRWASRTSVSLQRSASLDEFIGRDRHEYIEICTRLARAPDTPQRLAALRAHLRDRLRRSPVCDATAFAREMEKLYRQMCGVELSA